MNALEVREPTTTGSVMSVADIVATNWFFTTNLTDFCHCFLLVLIIFVLKMFANIQKKALRCNRLFTPAKGGREF